MCLNISIIYSPKNRTYRLTNSPHRDNRGITRLVEKLKKKGSTPES